MSKASRLRLRNERLRKIWVVARELVPGMVQYLHIDDWTSYTGGKIIWFRSRRDADKAATEFVLKNPSFVGRVWSTKRNTMRNPKIMSQDDTGLL